MRRASGPPPRVWNPQAGQSTSLRDLCFSRLIPATWPPPGAPELAKMPPHGDFVLAISSTWNVPPRHLQGSPFTCFAGTLVLKQHPVSPVFSNTSTRNSSTRCEPVLPLLLACLFINRSSPSNRLYFYFCAYFSLSHWTGTQARWGQRLSPSGCCYVSRTQSSHLASKRGKNLLGNGCSLSTSSK